MRKVVMIGQDHRVEGRAHCVYCQHGPLDGSFAVRAGSKEEIAADPDDAPKAGDLTVCANCGALLVFTQAAHGLGVRAAAAQDIKDAKANAELWQVITKFRKSLRRTKSAKPPAPPQPAKEVRKSPECAEGRHRDCKGNLGVSPGECECLCHTKEMPALKDKP